MIEKISFIYSRQESSLRENVSYKKTINAVTVNFETNFTVKDATLTAFTNFNL